MKQGKVSDKILNVIEQSELFSGLAPALLEKITSAAKKQQVDAGELLFQQGDQADAIWGVISGRIKETVRSEDGNEMTINVIEGGEIFGVVGVLDWGTRRAEAVATKNSSLFRINRRQFLELLQNSPELCFRVFILLCSQVRETTEALEDIALQKFPTRLAKKLATLVAGNHNPDNALREKPGPVVLNLSQTDLASLIGGKREHVNRQLRAWEKQGWLTLGRQKIIINDLEKLTSLVGNGNGVEKKQYIFQGSGVPFVPLEKTGAVISGKQKTPAAGVLKVGLIAVVVSDYSRHMMGNAAGTLKTLKADIQIIEKSVADSSGFIIGQVGDSIIVKFPDGPAALRTAKLIQKKIAPVKSLGDPKPAVLFRLGVHAGEIMVDGNRYVGGAINVALHLAHMAEAGGLYLSESALTHMNEKSRGNLTFLGNQRFPDIDQPIPVYSENPVPFMRRVWAHADSLRQHHLWPAAALGTLVVLLTLVWVTAWQFNDSPGQTEIPIAVLPFTNAGDQENDYLADGLAQEVRSALMALPNLRVIGEKSVNYFRENPASSEEIANVLQASYLLQGTIEKPNGKTLLAVHLFDAESGTEIWANSFSEPEQNLVEFRRVILQSLEGTLNLSQDPDDDVPALAVAARDPRANRLYLQARFLNTQGVQKITLRALPLLHEAVEIEPKYAEAWALLATIYQGLNPSDPDLDYSIDELANMSKEALDKAVEFGSVSVEVIVAKAILTKDPKTRKQLLTNALVFYPNNPDALLSRAFIYQKEYDFVAYRETLERVLLVDPLARGPMNMYAVLLMNLGKLEESKAVLERLQTLYPNTSPSYAILSAIAMRERDYVKAVVLAREGRPYGGFPDLWFGLEDFDWNISSRLRAAGPYAYVGDYETVGEILDEAYQQNPDYYESLIARGELASLRGDYIGAIKFFERAIPLLPEGETGLCWPQSYAAWLSWQRGSCPGAALLKAYRQTGNSQKANHLNETIVAEMNRIRDGYAAAGVEDEYFLYVEAEIQAINGQKEEALATLQKWRQTDPHQFNYVRRDPFFEALHGQPEFWQIVSDVEADLAELRAVINTAKIQTEE